MRNSSFDNSSSNEEEEKVDSDKGHEEKQGETGIYKLGLSVFYPKSRDYLYAVRKSGFLLTRKRKQCQIRELKKATLNSLFIKIMFTAQQLCISQKTFP